MKHWQTCCKETMQRAWSWMQLAENERRLFLGVFVLLVLYAFPIVLANAYYVDDLGRSRLGYFYWGGNGRVVTNAITACLIMGKTLQDVAPLWLFLSVALFPTRWCCSHDVFTRQ